MSTLFSEVQILQFGDEMYVFNDNEQDKAIILTF